MIRKNIDLSPEAVKILSIQAVEKGSNFKNHVQSILEELAKKIDAAKQKNSNLQPFDRYNNSIRRQVQLAAQ